MPRVKLKGLNVRRNSAGKWYVSIRANGVSLVTGFEGTKLALERHLGTPQILEKYNMLMRQSQRAAYADGTLGALIDWYKTRPAWTEKADRTKKDYEAVIAYIEPALVYNARDLVKADIAELRDRAYADGKRNLSNHMLGFLSALFTEAEEAGKMGSNPAKGLRRRHKADPNANRRWTDDEWEKIMEIAPEHLRVPLAMIRYAGPRKKDLYALRWDAYRPDPELGMALVFTASKNGVQVEIGVLPELRDILDSVDRKTLTICHNSQGKPYPSENALGKVFQDFKNSKAFVAALPDSGDLTIHGLRCTFASVVKEAGFTDRDVADAIGDKSESMGRHYARGADRRKNVVRIHNRMSGKE